MNCTQLSYLLLFHTAYKLLRVNTFYKSRTAGEKGQKECDIFVKVFLDHSTSDFLSVSQET